MFASLRSKRTPDDGGELRLRGLGRGVVDDDHLVGDPAGLCARTLFRQVNVRQRLAETGTTIDTRGASLAANASGETAASTRNVALAPAGTSAGREPCARCAARARAAPRP
jgi:hypothetical protein